MANCVGVDIGSTAAKAVVIGEDGSLLYKLVLPTGWSSVGAANALREGMEREGFDVARTRVIATGYGRVSVPYAAKTVTEISCHAQGVLRLLGRDCTVIDIGGQDTKVIRLRKGKVDGFLMNDKCAAGTGRFLEVMANTLAVDLPELFELAAQGGGTSISSMCTVFAESEVISLIGGGAQKENIAFAVCESIVTRVVALCGRQGNDKEFFLSGGLCESDYLRERLREKLRVPVLTSPMARYAGAIGAAVLAERLEMEQPA
ncbi:MAG: acyl-CoA dehydratase activase [Synergistaceae bacterium]|jgi:predicted CoA-substrate-specific enzyme activase|nr:acyl-CoA dehydratase activase [Synergistaceae bacterium]